MTMSSSLVLVLLQASLGRRQQLRLVGRAVQVEPEFAQRHAAGGGFEQRAVDDIAPEPGRAGLLLALQGAELSADVRRLGTRRSIGAEQLHETGPLGGIALGRGRPGLLLGDRREVVGGPDRVTDRLDRAGHDDDVPAPDPGPLVPGEPPGQTHMALGGAGGIPGHGGVDAVAPDEQVRNRLDGRSTEPHVPGA